MTWLAGFVLATVLVIATAAIILDRTRAHRSVFSVAWGLLIYLVLGAVLALAVASTYGANLLLRDDWAPLVAGLILLSLAPYRPALELATATASLTAVSALLALLQAPFAASPVPLATFAVAGSSSLACLGFASAAYAFSVNGSILTWLEQAWRSAAATAVEQRGGVARSVQQQRVSLVNRKVVPFFTRIGAAETLAPEDREEARELAQSIRALLVADVQRGWAQSLLDELLLAGARGHRERNRRRPRRRGPRTHDGATHPPARDRHASGRARRSLGDRAAHSRNGHRGERPVVPHDPHRWFSCGARAQPHPASRARTHPSFARRGPGRLRDSRV
ncbi:MAG: hypothetical protein ACJLS2_03545 [Microcella pacifica]